MESSEKGNDGFLGNVPKRLRAALANKHVRSSDGAWLVGGWQLACARFSWKGAKRGAREGAHLGLVGGAALGSQDWLVGVDGRLGASVRTF